jgi:hypothetical protein
MTPPVLAKAVVSGSLSFNRVRSSSSHTACLEATGVPVVDTLIAALAAAKQMWLGPAAAAGGSGRAVRGVGRR